MSGLVMTPEYGKEGGQREIHGSGWVGNVPIVRFPSGST